MGQQLNRTDRKKTKRTEIEQNGQKLKEWPEMEQNKHKFDNTDRNWTERTEI